MTTGSAVAAERLRVALGDRAYDIVVGSRLIETAGREIRPLMRRRHAVVVTDENVAGHWLAPLCCSLDEAGVAHHTVVLPAGEETKDLAHFGRLAGEILASGIERGSMLVALGGGVVGDLTGFAAATLLRGIDFVQVPTTLLAQVDSSVGGKTGINTALGKNLIGAFYQPRLVLADTDVLASLPRRELLAGYAETVKYGLIRDAEFFAWCERQGNALCALEPEPLRHAVVTSCAMKAAVVAGDEREEGERALLNFGHTFGHALETETGFSSRLLHGEAVALGMVLAFEFAACLGLAAQADGERVRRHFATTGLPTRLADVGLAGTPADRLLAHMGKDKKVRDGKLTLILPRRIGDAFVMKDAPAAELHEFLGAAA
ncbi:MAG TPA: 3-dehydroquinate synthase [Stellaceae bacterium]|jgi:3-dehydroquinate synthase|nr:3-dehydroquinate synthase [Stellaceae bacterium]